MRQRAAAGLVLTLLAAGCEFGERTVGAGRDQVVVHAVLNPGVFEQVILLERTLTGRVAVADSVRLDPLDPIVTGGGIPVSGATVVVYDNLGDSAVAREDRVVRPDGRGAGVYRFVNIRSDVGEDYLPVLPGRRYQLRIVTPEGHTVTGETLVPDQQPAHRTEAFDRFNRDHDSLFLFWTAVPNAARYALVVETPYGEFFTLLDSLQYLIAGSLRNIIQPRLPHVFVPGFRQEVTVGAVDTNYFDYFRSRNDPFTGSGLISHLQGGIGVFGSYVLIRYRYLNVVADQDEPIEGNYLRQEPASSPAPENMQLYVDERLALVSQITGSWITATRPAGLIGRLEDDRVTLLFLRGADTAFTLTGRRDGDLITGTMSGGYSPFGSGERVVYRKVSTTP